MNQSKSVHWISQKDTFSKGGMVMYQQVLSKNFQIIQNFLKRFHDVYSKQQQFQQTIISFRQRVNFFQNRLQHFADETKQINKNFQKKIIQFKNTLKNKQFNLDNAKNNDQHLKLSQQLNYYRGSSIVLNQQTKKQLQKQMIVKMIQINSQVKQRLNKDQDDIKQTNTKVNQIQSNLRSYLNILQKQVKNNKKQFVQIKIFNQFKQSIFKQIKDDIALITSKIDIKLLQQMSNHQNINLQQYTKRMDNIDNKIHQIQQSVLQQIDKINKSTSQIKSDLIKVVEQSVQVFSNKEETRKYFTLIQKKLYRFKLQQNLNDNGQTDPSITCKEVKCLSCHHRFTKTQNLKSKYHKNGLLSSKLMKVASQFKQSEKDTIQLTSAFGHRRLVKNTPLK